MLAVADERRVRAWKGALIGSYRFECWFVLTRCCGSLWSQVDNGTWLAVRLDSGLTQCCFHRSIFEKFGTPNLPQRSHLRGPALPSVVTFKICLLLRVSSLCGHAESIGHNAQESCPHPPRAEARQQAHSSSSVYHRVCGNWSEVPSARACSMTSGRRTARALNYVLVKFFELFSGWRFARPGI
jgi:hypothetical protein